MTASSSSVTEMLDKLGLPALENRRQIASLVMFYTINTARPSQNLSPALHDIPHPHYVTGFQFHTLGLTHVLVLS